MLFRSDMSLATCLSGAGVQDYAKGAISYVTGNGWNAGPGVPFVSGPYYGDQAGWAEGPAVTQGWNYANQGCN